MISKFVRSIARGASAALIILAGTYPNASFAQPARLDKVKVANQGVQFTYGPFYVALHGGFFKEQGIEIEETAQNSPAITMSSVLAGDTEFGLGPTDQVMRAVARNQPLRIIGRIITGFPNMILLRKPIADNIAKTTGVTVNSPRIDRARALKDKSFVVTSAGSTLELVLFDQVAFAGLNPQRDVTVTYSGSGGATAAAIQAARVDGAVSGFPFGIEAVTLGRAVIWIDPIAGEIPELHDMDFSTLFTSLDTIRNKPDLVQRMVNAITKAQAYLQTNKDQSRQLLRKVFPTMAPEILDASFNKIYPLFPKNPLSTPAGFQKAQDLLNKTQSQKITPSFANTVDMSFAQKAIATIK